MMSSTAEAQALAHRLAAMVFWLQMSSGHLGPAVRDLAGAHLPPEPPTFGEVVAQVEQIEGVRFRELFERLPRRAPDGDAAIAEVWRLVAEERERPSGGPDMDQVLHNFDPLLRDIAAVARGHDESREQVVQVLPQLEENGWRLTDAVHRIWEGERDAEALTANVDHNSAQLIRRILELIELPTPEEALAAAPAPVRDAIEADDLEALKAAVEALPEEEAGRVVRSLHEAGVLEAG